jgi:uncharacterized protein (TIGR02391 family)
MQSLPTALRRLEHLKALVDEYAPLKYESTERSHELAKQIPIAYGEVEDVYRHFAGDSKVEVADRGHKKIFRNFFEAGWLSGRTFHSTEGHTELDKVVGRVRAVVEDGESAAKRKGDPIENAWPLLHPRVQVIAGDRFRATHYADAVEAALKELSNTVKGLVLQRGGPELDGVALMQTAFSPNKPLIVLADLSTQTGKDMQRGYMDLFAGAMAAIRNPKAHGNVTITPERALQLLFLASTLWYTLDERS